MKKERSKLYKLMQAWIVCTFIYVVSAMFFYFYLESNLFGVYTGDTTWLLFSIGAVTGVFFILCIGFIIALKKEIKRGKEENGNKA